MQLEIARENLLKILRRVSGAVERKNVQYPILSNILLDVNGNGLTVVATDMNIELQSNIADVVCLSEGTATVPFRKLNDIARAFSEESRITIKLQDKKILVLSGKSKFTLATLPVDSYPHLDIKSGVLNFFLSKEKLKNLLERTAFSMADQDVRYFLNGMLFEVRNSRLYTVAADGHRLAMSYIPIEISKNKSIRVIVPRKGIMEIMRTIDESSDEVEVIISINNITVKSGSFSLTSKLLEGKFPDYERVIPKESEKLVFANKDALKSALIRASALFSEKQRGVKLSLSQGKMKIAANNMEQDEAEEYLEVDYNGDDFDISFNARYIIDYLNVVKDNVVKMTFKDANNGALLEDNVDGSYVIMPMRI